MVLLVKAKYTNSIYFKFEDDFGEPMSLSGLNLKLQIMSKKGEQILLKGIGSGLVVDPYNPGVLEVVLDENESSLLSSQPQPLSYVLYYEREEGKVVMSSGIITAYKFSGEVREEEE